MKGGHKGGLKTILGEGKKASSTKRMSFVVASHKKKKKKANVRYSTRE